MLMCRTKGSTKDLRVSPRADSFSSDEKECPESSMQTQNSSGTLSVLLSDGSRQLSGFSSPFVSVLPGAGADCVKSDEERADEDIAQQLFRAAQARWKQRGLD